LLVPTAAAHAETKPLNPFAKPGGSAARPSAFAAPNVAPLPAPVAFGRVFSWVLRTQQSLQRDLATSVKASKATMR
jgi:hypothetical protein